MRFDAKIRMQTYLGGGVLSMNITETVVARCRLLRPRAFHIIKLAIILEQVVISLEYTPTYLQSQFSSCPTHTKPLALWAHRARGIPRTDTSLMAPVRGEGSGRLLYLV